MRTIVMICLALAVAGCALLPSREAMNARRAANAEASCRAIGLDPSSEKWVNCMILMMAAEIRGAAASGGGKQGSGKQGMSFMCKDAISRGDRGGTLTFC